MIEIFDDVFEFHLEFVIPFLLSHLLVNHNVLLCDLAFFQAILDSLALLILFHPYLFELRH